MDRLNAVAIDQAVERFADRYWRLNNLYTIKDETGRAIPFRMNAAQEQLYNELWSLNLILKARQLGFTTLIQLILLDACLFNSNTSAGIVAHNREDAEAFIALEEAPGDLAAVEETGIAAFPAVRERFLAAKEIVRKGRFTAKADPGGPQPPLQMPAWAYLLEEREIDALLVYFVSLYDWERDE